jgi:hypothetical protein
VDFLLLDPRFGFRPSDWAAVADLVRSCFRAACAEDFVFRIAFLVSPQSAPPRARFFYRIRFSLFVSSVCVLLVALLRVSVPVGPHRPFPCLRSEQGWASVAVEGVVVPVGFVRKRALGSCCSWSPHRSELPSSFDFLASVLRSCHIGSNLIFFCWPRCVICFMDAAAWGFLTWSVAETNFLLVLKCWWESSFLLTLRLIWDSALVSLV